MWHEIPGLAPCLAVSTEVSISIHQWESISRKMSGAMISLQSRQQNAFKLLRISINIDELYFPVFFKYSGIHIHQCWHVTRMWQQGLDLGHVHTTDKITGMEKFSWWLCHVMLSVLHRRERGTAGAQLGKKPYKRVIPRARSRRWAAFIATFICHGERDILHNIYRCAKTHVWMAFTVYS